MKNKKLILIVILFTLLTAALGCGTSNSNNTASSETQDTQNQRGMNRADLRGQIVSIKDNKITLKLIKTPEFNYNNGQNYRNRNNANTSNNTNNRNNTNSKGFSRRNNNNQSSRNFQQQLEFTGKTQTLTIAKDAEISIRKRGQNGGNVQNISIKDIKNNSIIQVWLSDKDKNVISRISLMEMQNN